MAIYKNMSERVYWRGWNVSASRCQEEVGVQKLERCGELFSTSLSIFYQFAYP